MTDHNGGATLVAAFPVERRINPFRPELRKAEGDRPAHIVGYASVFGKLSRKLPGGFVERVNPAAFRSSKAQNWDGVVCRFNHNDDFLLGTIVGRTLALDFDENGLAYDVIPPSFRSDIVELMHRGDVSSSSFAFRMPGQGGDDWALSDFGMPLRTLLDVELVDVAPVTTPAYPDATAAARSFEGAVESLARKFEADPTEIRSLFDNNQTVKLFRRTDMRSANVEPPTVPDISEPAPYWEEEFRKNYSTDERKKMAAKGHAMPDGSYPIADEEDLHNAIKLAGNGSASKSAIKAHIKKRANAMGKTDALPDDWKDSAPEKKSEDTDIDAEIRAAEDFLAKVKAKKAGKKKAGNDDDETDGEDSSGTGTEDEGRAADSDEEAEEETDSAEEAEDTEGTEERAAKANYEDLETCAECNTPGQYGKHCTNCGKPMAPDAPMGGKFCANCGSKTDGKRSEHECSEVREDETSVETADGHTVGTGDDQLAELDPALVTQKRHNMLAQLQEKRFDRFLDDEA